MPNVLFAGTDENWQTYKTLIPEALKARGVSAIFSRDLAPETVDYIVYSPLGPVQDFSPYTRLKAVLSLWAGVERIVGNKTLQAPLCRMVDGGLKKGMAEWVAGHCLRYHLGMDAHIVNLSHTWRSGMAPPLAEDRTIGILGLGELGQACAEALNCLGFKVAGWSRHQKNIEGIDCYAGPDGLKALLAQTKILVLLLPQTQETTHILNARTLALLPKGACILNPGRGPLINDEALLAALNTNHIAHATLDVFSKEPLPQAHPYWAHPNVTVTPHIASETRPKSAAQVIAANIARGESGTPLLFQVNQSLGY
ncbi:MAG TPA: glyoxylate/hydroxypyruvate reductase A [Rhodobacteraceae bacterium]|nr:glyoxylate/hydroxypyruvate reductase A [Paracoccaceae bacterium]